MSSFVPSGYLTFSDALDRVASVLHIEKRDAQKTLRQLLYSGQVPSRIIERSGLTYDTPAHVWGGIKWGEALKSGSVCFDVAAYAPDVHGQIIIPESRLIETLKSCIPQETETHQRGTTAAESDSTPAGQDRSQELGREDQQKGGRAPKYDRGLQQFIDRLFAKFKADGGHLTCPGLKTWLNENAQPDEAYDPEPPIPDCGEIEFYDNKVWWKNAAGAPKSITIRALERYLKRAREAAPATSA